MKLFSADLNVIGIQGENISVTFMLPTKCPADCWGSIELNELAIITVLELLASACQESL
ncbi:hypothetical protein IOC57_10100 [Bacillus sp. SD075]|uniref:hypothetical protein n=1 Tax=Bacillus sp. SD075 TaxID=2781732 RepID=UPI001A95D6D1|nr:hypothetical protein [Bacillus sp. SD075]MBO0998098.1 hypothetical protein [Bacillus sp. SD075]